MAFDMYDCGSRMIISASRYEEARSWIMDRFEIDIDLYGQYSSPLETVDLTLSDPDGYGPFWGIIEDEDFFMLVDFIDEFAEKGTVFHLLRGDDSTAISINVDEQGADVRYADAFDLFSLIEKRRGVIQAQTQRDRFIRPTDRSAWSEVRCDYLDDTDGFWRVDAWLTADDEDEEGKVVAYVDDLTGRVVYADPDAKYDPLVASVVDEKVDEIVTRPFEDRADLIMPDPCAARPQAFRQ